MTDTDRTDENSQSEGSARIADRVSASVPDDIAERATSARRRATTAIRTSRLSSIGETCRRYVTASYLYRWLTKEPDPEVIVIDLRETRTVGPFIRLLDRTIVGLVPIWRRSRAKALTDGVAGAIRTAPFRVGGVVLAATVVANLLFALATQSVSISGAIVHLGLLAVAAVGVRSSTSLAELLDTGIAQLLIATFEPPEPPERDDPTGGEEANDSTQ